MSEREQPTHGQEIGPCAICGKAAMPKYGEFLCRRHGELNYVRRVQDGE